MKKVIVFEGGGMAVLGKGSEIAVTGTAGPLRQVAFQLKEDKELSLKELNQFKSQGLKKLGK